MARLTQFSYSLFLLGLTFGLASCGRSDRPVVNPVTGKVLYRGEPAEGAQVTLVPLENSDPDARRPGAMVRSDGSFRLSTYASYDGALAGRYAVTILYRSPDKKVDDENMGPDLLKGRYADPGTTPLKIEISKGVNNLEPFMLP
jgi:hypothetical protein